MFCSPRLLVCVALALALRCAPAAANEQLALDMADGRLDRFSLLEAAGTIGGMDSSSLQAARLRLQDVVASLDRESHAHDAERLAALLALLHDRIFTGRYDAAASQISATLAHGDFNCASSATLFLVAAEMANFSTHAVLLPGHVRCRVWIEADERWYDVEPSVRSGQPDQPLGNERSANQRGRELTDVQLLAKLYYNLGIDELKQGNYVGALQYARYGWQFDPRHTAAKDNVAAIVNNWSLALCQQLQFEEALRLIRHGLRQSPDDDLLTVSEIHIYVAWMQELMQRGDLGGVEMRLHDALARYPDSALLQNIDHRLRQAVRAR